MANTKITDLTALTTPVSGDLLPIVDISDTSMAASGTDKKITYNNFKTQIATDLGISGTNTGDQTSIVGITGTKAQFDTAVTDGNILYVGDVTTNATHTGDATGSGALTVVKIQGKDFPTLSAADDQKYPKYVDASNAFVMTAISSGGGDNVVFVPPGAFVLGTNCTLVADATTAWIGVASFADGVQGRALINAKVPKGCSGITSIEVIYHDTSGSVLQLYLEYETASLNLDSLPSAVVSDNNGGVAQYASSGVSGNIAKVTVPAAAYNGLTNVDADDIITMRINREGANANDTYGVAWEVIGVVFTFTVV